MKLADAIAREEGFYVEGSRAARNNNPGNLEWGAFAKAHGAIGSGGRFAIFPSAIQGFQALDSLLLETYGDDSIAEMLDKYAPPNENNTPSYLNNVLKWLAVPATTLVKTVV